MANPSTGDRRSSKSAHTGAGSEVCSTPGTLRAVARRELTPIQYEVWLLTVEEELSSSQIADRLQIQARTVRQHRARAEMRLREARRAHRFSLEGVVRYDVTVAEGHEAYGRPDVTMREAVRSAEPEEED